MHLLIDGYSGERARLQSEEVVRGLLEGWPSQIGMTRISEPFVLTYHSPQEEDWGVSGFVLIAESHISIHTFPVRRYVNIDLFSCKPFDFLSALRYAQEALGLTTLGWRLLERGLEAYNPARAREAVTAPTPPSR